MREPSDFIKAFNVSSQTAQPDIGIQAKMGKSPGPLFLATRNNYPLPQNVLLMYCNSRLITPLSRENDVHIIALYSQQLISKSHGAKEKKEQQKGEKAHFSCKLKQQSQQDSLSVL